MFIYLFMFSEFGIRSISNLAKLTTQTYVECVLYYECRIFIDYVPISSTPSPSIHSIALRYDLHRAHHDLHTKQTPIYSTTWH